ncbi:hypothetical protein BMI85_20425 [Thioclava sp. DLFJ4-1]|nr:hypothetical protein BMI85_20425 [Thioclava sp. DLFJ4-1]
MAQDRRFDFVRALLAPFSHLVPVEIYVERVQSLELVEVPPFPKSVHREICPTVQKAGHAEL